MISEHPLKLKPTIITLLKIILRIDEEPPMNIDQAKAHPKWEQQLDLEAEMRSMGVERFTKAQIDARSNKQESRTLPVRRLMDRAHERMVEAINGFMEAATSGKAGRRHAAVSMFGEVLEMGGSVDLLAHLTLRVVLDGLSTPGHLTNTAISISTAIEDEIHFAAFKSAEPRAYKVHMNRMKTKGNARYKRVSTTMTATKFGVERWELRDKLLMGTKLIEMLVEVTGLVVTQKLWEGPRKWREIIRATPETIEWLKTEASRLEWLAPMYMPCVMPPKPWTTPFDGGYWSGRVRKLTLVKTNSRGYLAELKDKDLSQVYGAVNALQDTAWGINTKVLDVMRTLWDQGTTLGIIPEVDPAPMPNRPGWLTPEMTKEEMTPEQLDAFKEWKGECAQVHDSNARLISKRASFSRMLWVAERFKEESFHFPYTLDFRGRIYPMPLFLHPQGDDAQRGLLEFASEVPINDEDGAMWLAIHGAGCWGVDKVSMEERYQWVLDHEEAILAASNDPLSHRFWADAEKPFQALAFCFDWAGFKREGYDYCSSLPVQMDGTCNGLQNFSAILRDEIGGAAVNLIPADTPQDIYTRVAELVAKRVEEDVLCPELSTLALGWVGKVTRKVCKRPVMTLAYGAREFGFKQQVFDDSVKPWKLTSPDTFPWEGSGWAAADYMGKLIWSCVGEVVVAARSAMDWLQEAARIAAKQGLPVNWTTPTGFMVQQAYYLPDVKVVELAFQKVRMELRYNVGSEKLDTRRQSSGISPNWVHSLDASHMVKTINAAHEAGMMSFSMIHDSYGTHAGNAQVLATCLREEFVRMYSETDVLATFRDDLMVQLPEGTELPPLPPHGSLDLSLVLESPFFFA